MASVNPLSRELVFKIVYYGPGLCGKTTTLEHIHATAKPEHRGKLVSLATPVDRTLYFDFLPVRLPPVRGMNIRLQLFTVPGQVYFNATRKLVLTGADGVVFVSDSQIVRADANLESLENLRENLSDQGRDLAVLPIVFQHNKRDLPDLLPVEELDNMLNPFGAPSLATSAKTGLGIYEALQKISERVMEAFKDRLPELYEGDITPSFEAVEGGLANALRDATDRASPPSDVVIARIGTGGAHPSIPPDSQTPVSRSPPVSTETPARPEPPAAPRAPAPAARAPLRSSPTLHSMQATLGYTPGPNVLPAPPQYAMAQAEQADDARAEAALAKEPRLVPPALDGAMAPPASLVTPVEATSVEATEPKKAAESSRGEAARSEPASRQPASQAQPTEGTRLGVSFAELWPEVERTMVRDVEDAISRGRYWRAIELCDTLVSRVLAGAAGLFGTTDAPRDAAVVPMLLGLDGRRYLSFRSVVREARDDGLITAREALAAYSFAIDCRLARSSIR